MKVKKLAVFIYLSFFAFALLMFPYQRIYIEESKPVEFYRGEKPSGLIEAHNNYVVLSYGTLLNQRKERFLVQFLLFNSEEEASSLFEKSIEIAKNGGYEVNLTSLNGEKEATIKKIDVIEGVSVEKEYSIAVLSKNKILFISGNKENIERVKRWFLAQNQ